MRAVLAEIGWRERLTHARDGGWFTVFLDGYGDVPGRTVRGVWHGPEGDPGAMRFWGMAPVDGPSKGLAPVDDLHVVVDCARNYPEPVPMGDSES